MPNLECFIVYERRSSFIVRFFFVHGDQCCFNDHWVYWTKKERSLSLSICIFYLRLLSPSPSFPPLCLSLSTYCLQCKLTLWFLEKKKRLPSTFVCVYLTFFKEPIALDYLESTRCHIHLLRFLPRNTQTTLNGFHTKRQFEANRKKHPRKVERRRRNDNVNSYFGIYKVEDRCIEQLPPPLHHRTPLRWNTLLTMKLRELTLKLLHSTSAYISIYIDIYVYSLSIVDQVWIQNRLLNAGVRVGESARHVGEHCAQPW